MSEITKHLSKKGLFLAVLLVAGMVMTGFKPATENTVQGPPAFYIILCETNSGTTPLMATQPKEIGQRVQECKKDFGGKIERVIPFFGFTPG